MNERQEDKGKKLADLVKTYDSSFKAPKGTYALLERRLTGVSLDKCLELVDLYFESEKAAPSVANLINYIRRNVGVQEQPRIKKETESEKRVRLHYEKLGLEYKFLPGGYYALK